MLARLLSIAAVAIVLAGCGGGGDDSGPIVVGASLPLTGQDAQTGTAVKRGYDIWLKDVNRRGGILGRGVELKILDDHTNQNAVITDYNTLLGRHKADFVFGTFSTRLTLPALGVVERHRKLYLDPAGGAPEVFDRASKRYFYTEPAPSWNFGTEFAKHIASRPDHPRDVAYVLTKDPFTSSTVTGIEDVFKRAGIRTALRASYPFGTRNFDPIAARVKESGAEMVVNAGGFEDETGFVRAMIKAGVKPRVLYQSSSPVYTTEYPEAVGAANTSGVFYPAGYSPTLKTPGNAGFVKAYRDAHGSDPGRLSAAGFAVGQVLEQAVKAVGSKGIENQDALADWLHAHPVDTVIGPLKWDERGVPQSPFAIGQWQDGKPEVVLPPNLATSRRILPCWRSCP